MEFLEMLMTDPIVFFSIIVILATCIIISYMAYFFISNINKANQARQNNET